jgi:hypothetical protein
MDPAKFYPKILESLEENMPILPEGSSEEESNARILQRKFYFAGCSARFFFDFNVSEIRKQVKAGFDESTDPALLASCLVAKRADTAINRFFYTPSTLQYEDAMDATSIKREFASEYVARTLLNLFGDGDLLKQMTSYCADHPAMDGWVLQCDFLHAVRKNTLSDRVYRCISTPSGADIVPVDWIAAKYKYFEQDEYIGDSGYLLENDVWLMPRVYNQGGFDAAQLVLINSFRWIRFIQVTRSTTHTLKLAYMKQFADSINRLLPANQQIVNIEIVIVTDRKKVQAYSPQPGSWDVSAMNPVGTIQTTHLQYHVAQTLVRFNRAGQRYD